MLKCYVLTCGRSVTAFSAPTRSQLPWQGNTGQEIESRWERDFPNPSIPAPWGHTASCAMGTGSFPGVEIGRGVTLDPQPLLWSRSKNRVGLYLYSPQRPSWLVKDGETYLPSTKGYSVSNQVSHIRSVSILTIKIDEVLRMGSHYKNNWRFIIGSHP
jgi:hypothetical protein